MPISEQIYKFTVSEQDSGLRADIVLFRLLPNHSRAQIKKLIESQNVLLNGGGLKASSRLTVGQELSVKIPSPEKIEASPEDIPISVIYEDQSIIVVNKPANLVVHPGAGVNRGTLVNAILFRCRDLGSIGGKIRPGIVHRLDKDTSGVMVIAKNDASHNSLVEQFKAREVKKSYLALVYGNLKVESGCFESEIGRHPVKRIKMSSKSRSGRKAITKWIVERRFGIATLVNVEPMTGRTHQIRVHFSENGHPIIGDKVYGTKRQKINLIGNSGNIIDRQALHAEKLGFKHPINNEYIEFTAPLPYDIKSAIEKLDTERNRNEPD